MHTVDNLILKTADGYELAATHFAADSNQFIVMGSATAVPRGFYKRFAEFAQARGINVITVDYRGIGELKRGSLKDLHTSYAEWSKYDLAAAVGYAAARGKVWLASHSLAATRSANCHNRICCKPLMCAARIPAGMAGCREPSASECGCCGMPLAT
jgi:predicted alpha/beta hydrolase